MVQGIDPGCSCPIRKKDWNCVAAQNLVMKLKLEDANWLWKKVKWCYFHGKGWVHKDKFPEYVHLTLTNPSAQVTYKSNENLYS